VDYTKSLYSLSLRACCRLLRISRSVYNYQPDYDRDNPVVEALSKLAEKYPRYGFPKLFVLLKREGHRWNHKRVHRVYCKMNLNMRRKFKKRLPARHPQPLSVPEAMNQSWLIDFMSDSLWDGRKFRTFNVVDDFNREALAIEVDLSLPSQRVIRVLDRLVAWRGFPQQLRMDNEPEFISLTIADWAETHGVHLEYIEKGKPTQNSNVERFNGTYRTEVLNYYMFQNLTEVREITDQWLEQYNEERSHESLGALTPREYARASYYTQ